MPFPISQSAKEISHRLVRFCEDRVFPAESLHFKQIEDARKAGKHWEVVPPIVETLKSEAKKFNLWNLFLPESPIEPLNSLGNCMRYGTKLTNFEYGLMCEVMGRSVLLAPEVFNCSAPDTGNMEVLSRFGTRKQKHTWLLPLLEGTIRSCFAMTEKRVASSDATNIETHIERDKINRQYVINGHKDYISGAGDPRCKIAIVMGKIMSPGQRVTKERRHHFYEQSVVLVPMNTPGVKLVRPMHVFGYDDAPHGHFEMIFDDVCVPFENILLGEGRGFEITQAQLGPRRIHHCMRAIGAAERFLELFVKRSKVRTAFGLLLAQNSLVCSEIAKSRCELDSARELNPDLT